MAASTRRQKSRNWVFTLFADNGEFDALASDPTTNEPFPQWWHDERVSYCKYQLERAPDTGRLHIQGMISFKKGSRPMTTVKKIIGDKAHCEVCKDIQASIRYCGKPETRVKGPWEHGDPPAGQGARNDLTWVWQEVKKRTSSFDMIEADPHLARYQKHIQFMRQVSLAKDSDRQDRKMAVYIFWGPTNTGKTYTAMNLMAPKDWVYKMDPPERGTQMWWDGYEGQHTVVFDEFEGENYCSMSRLKVLLDKYTLRLPVKGSFTNAVYEQVVMCSNVAPRQ